MWRFVSVWHCPFFLTITHTISGCEWWLSKILFIFSDLKILISDSASKIRLKLLITSILTNHCVCSIWHWCSIWHCLRKYADVVMEICSELKMYILSAYVIFSLILSSSSLHKYTERSFLKIFIERAPFGVS